MDPCREVKKEGAWGLTKGKAKGTLGLIAEAGAGMSSPT